MNPFIFVKVALHSAMLHATCHTVALQYKLQEKVRTVEETIVERELSIYVLTVLHYMYIKTTNK